MNALNGVWSGTYIMQIIIQQEFQKLTKILLKNLTLKTQNFQSKLETFTKQKKIPLAVLLAMKIKKNIQSMYQINVSRKTC